MINYLIGSAVYPKVPGNKVIAHVCNDVGAWGSGFVVSISKRWKDPAADYKKWFYSGEPFELGKVQIVETEEDCFVANMIGQYKLRSLKNLVPLKYDALENCLNTVAEFAIKNNASVHMPRIGCGRAGGDWDKVERIIEKTLCDRNIVVYVYDIH